ncbi:MAG: glycosyltransferase family 2 protein [Candidatus Hodarchaeota archaeon]
MTDPKLNINSHSTLEDRGKIYSRKNNNIELLHSCIKKYKKKTTEKIISIIIPVYNEENTIRQILEKIPKNNLIEIIVIDDCSMDNSISEIKKVKHQGEIHIIRHKINRGYGEALLTGIRHSTGDVFITMDSDGQHRTEDIFNLVLPIFEGEADICIGSRYKGSFNYKLPVATRFGEALLEIIIILLFRQKVKNNQCGFRALHKKTKHIFETIKFKGYAFTTELILLAMLNGYKIKEVPINLASREYGSSNIILRKLLFSLILCFGFYFIKRIVRILFKKKLDLKIMFL